MALFGLLGSALGLAGSIFGANKQAKAMKKAAIPYSVFGPAGGAAVDPKTKKITLTQDTSNPFYQLFSQLAPELFGDAVGMGDEFLGGVDPEVAAAYEGLFGQGLTDRIGENYGLLRAMAEPDEMSAFRNLADNLYARTGLSTTGDADKLAAFERARDQADLARQLQAIGLGREEAGTRFEAAMKAKGLGLGEQAQQFGFGMSAFGGFQQLFENLLRQAGLGTQTTAAAAPASMAAASSAGLPWQAGMNFLNNSGLFSALGNMGGGGSIPLTAPNLGAGIGYGVNIPFPTIPITPVPPIGG